MKKLLFSCFVLFTFLCAKCEDETPKNPIDLLPPATQTGENTFGCLVDGEAFTPDGRPLSFTKDYIFSNGKYYLSVNASRIVDGDVISIGCSSEGIDIIEGQNYFLLERTDGKVSGRYFALSDAFYTNSQYTGEMKITKHDNNNYIMSGTFWFDVKDKKGIVHQIREGRFDIKY